MTLQIKKWHVLLAGIIVAAIILWFWGKNKFTPEKKPLAIVKVQTVKSAIIPEKITAIGTLKAPQDVYISAESGGYITKVNFVDGQTVKAGDLLFQLDDTKEQADLLSTKAAYVEAKNKLDRMQKLLPLHYVSLSDIDTANAEVQAKLAAVKSTQDAIDKKAMTAPFNGTVGARTVSVGDFVTAGQKLVELVDRSILKVDYSVPEKYFQQVKLGQAVSVIASNATTRTFAGKVVYIAPVIDPTTHTLALQATVPNIDNALAPGLFVTVSNIIGSNQQTILVPEESLIKSPDKVSVYRIVNNKALETPITIGTCQEGGYVEVLSGLNAGDVIVIAGQDKLQEGDAVRVVE